MSKYNLKNWSFKKWFLGNWSTIKEIVKVGVPALLALSFVSSNPVVVAGITIVGKFVLDLGHYWMAE